MHDYPPNLNYLKIFIVKLDISFDEINIFVINFKNELLCSRLHCTKEIGIKKVLGASVSRIVFLLSKEFIRWVLVANVIAWPLAYLAGQKWLQNFAYRINLEWFSFVLAAVFELAIAALTVSFQAFKAATANPQWMR